MWSGTIGAHPDSAGYRRRADWVFTNRRGGVSQGEFESLNLAAHVGDDDSVVAENRQQLGEMLGSPPASLAFIDAEHGHNVYRITEHSLQPEGKCDGLVTKSADIALVALAADCTPIVLADTKNAVVGVVHCGWRGVVAGIVPATIEAMLGLGAECASMAAIVGPAICQDCYQVDSECADQLMAVVPDSAHRHSDGRWYADVSGAACGLLERAGIGVTRIEECTYTNPDLYSYRRDGRTGRQGAAIVLRSMSVAP
ncbi:MAG: peptidoglycan editing factor PgeF [Candidatus Nanopelagicales bacterium]